MKPWPPVTPWPPLLTGGFLVATLDLLDPNFTRTLVYMARHDDEGALGLVLNRPLGARNGEILPEWEGSAVGAEALYEGGPVQKEFLSVFRPRNPQADQVGEAWASARFAMDPLVAPVFDYLKDTWSLLPEAQRFPVKVCSGYAGWSAGQLEAELAAGGWHWLADPPEDLWYRQGEELWKHAMDSLGALYGIAARTGSWPSWN